MTLEIYVDVDKVTIEHQYIKRPDHISRSKWLDFWEAVKWEGKKYNCEVCGRWIG